MQLNYEEPLQAIFTIKHMNQLDTQTARQLHNLGVEEGSMVIVLRKYPFHGPVVIEFDHQKIGLRNAVYQTLLGGQQHDNRCPAWKS
ncbi:hypothetical protein C5L31_000962 [Secundilactobacillus malefermentans]|uniref:Ferrous iron transporter FeoA-like domain-containing protein n=1 Tax=Secundilactobacillus malefermentans TaxID=176292 RepID=A0A4R5NGS2_9LACO|nr:FeoA family protein [Secundilactobacillus malefermentans]KRM58135.1 hypothetical protein FD44_GL000777 [Secundilactobacillus malefermentans DSM 5705 = KCTC 3548]TDG73715.1 hypothetical protein C5L31_000962 [Secundilactobacillus malefermentans]